MSKSNSFLSKLGLYTLALITVLVLLSWPIAFINNLIFPFLEKLPGGKVISTIVSVIGLLVYYVAVFLNTREQKDRSAK